MANQRISITDKIQKNSDFMKAVRHMFKLFSKIEMVLPWLKLMAKIKVASTAYDVFSTLKGLHIRQNTDDWFLLH